MAATIDKTRQGHYSAFYSDNFYSFLQSDKNFISASKVIQAAKNYVNFQSVIDIGCGVGNMLRACLDSGVKIIRGVDGSWVNQKMLVIPPENFSQFDISRPGLKDSIPEKFFDLAISSEVAEHIEPKEADIYLDNLTSFSDVILFSAAIPHQGGTHHVNEQWPSYWIKKFKARNFIPVDCIRPKIWNDENIYFWYRQNMLFFVRENVLKNYPLLEQEAGRPVYDVIHPEFSDNMSFKNACKNIIPSFLRAVKRRIGH